MTRRHIKSESRIKYERIWHFSGLTISRAAQLFEVHCEAKEAFYFILYQYTTYPYYYLALVHPRDQHVRVKFDMLEIHNFIESTYIFAANFLEANSKGDVNGS